ncbi:hypothetical protein [Pseudonocardia sp. D17]|uniref:hypothetical protein n=1 Tax=Pseudonocardia sp. D17 TaxID=882661 RepID=UPI002B398E47|nr:hypothetical protein PSD17_56390 [Pseudonocardia sp. D17]
MARQVRGWDEQDAFTGWRRVLFWQRGELRRTKARANRRDRRRSRWAHRADGGVVPPPGYADETDRVPVILSPGELWPACCPGVTLVDHDGIGPSALLIEHYRQAHGRTIAWRTDTPAHGTPTGPSGKGDRGPSVGG